MNTLIPLAFVASMAALLWWLAITMEDKNDRD